MLDLMRDIILATDLAHHLRIFKDLQRMAEGASPEPCRAHTIPWGTGRSCAGLPLPSGAWDTWCHFRGAWVPCSESGDQDPAFSPQWATIATTSSTTACFCVSS